MKVFEKIVDDLSKPREVTRIPGKVGSVLPRYSKINKDEIIGYVLDMKMPKARGKRKGRLVEYYGTKKYGSAEAAKLKAEGDYQKIIMDPKYRELMTDRLLVDRDAVVRSFLNHLENVSEFDGYEKIAPELKYLRASDTDHQYEKINKYFRGWVNGDFEVEGIDRKNLTKQAKKEIKNWSPKARGERTKVRQERMQFLDELNNQDIPLTKVKKEFKKKFGKGKYYNDGTFASTINQFTQLKREGSLPSNADGSKTLNYGVSAGERSPWLKQALAENVQFSSNYNRLISAADDARAKGNLTRAKNLEDTASRFFGTKGIFTRLPGNAEHPLSFTYGGKDNILKMDSLVRGDLNQTKKVLFDNPIRDLSKEYNLSTTTAKRKKQIRDSMINRKAFMNYLTSGSFDKGMAQSVNFDFTPNKVYLKSTVTPLDKLPKGYDFKKFVKKGEGYSKAFEKYGGDLGLTTKSGFSKRVAIADDNLKKIIAKLSPNSTCAVFRKPKAEGGGVSGLDECFEEGMQALKEKNINKPHQVQGAKQLMNAGKRIGASTFVRRLLDLGILGEVAFLAGDVGIRQAMGRPFSEAFKAATFREGQADKERIIRSGGSPEVIKARELDEKLKSVEQEIRSAESLGDYYSSTDIDALKQRRQNILKELAPFEKYLSLTSPQTISTNIREQNIIDADLAKSPFSRMKLSAAQGTVPSIADYGEIGAPVPEDTPINTSLKSQNEILKREIENYNKKQAKKLLPSSEEAILENLKFNLGDSTADREAKEFYDAGYEIFPDDFTSYKMQLEAQSPGREEQMYGFNPDKGLEIPSLLPKGTYIPSPRQRREQEELMEEMGRLGAASGGLMNLTRTIPPESGPNAKGLESLRKYATKRY